MGFPLLTPEENFPFQRISWSPTRPRLWRAARALISCGYTTLGRAASPHESSNNLNNINGLKFYHEIRGKLKRIDTSSARPENSAERKSVPPLCGLSDYSR